MPLNFPADFVTKIYASQNAGFNICYFKNTTHQIDAPPHFHLTISLKNGISLVLCMITSQMQKLENKYFNTEPDALNCLISLDNTVFPCISRPCVIDCNEAKLLSSKELTLLIDPVKGMNHKVADKDIDSSLKIKIIRAINESPMVQGDIKTAVLAAYPEFFG